METLIQILMVVTSLIFVIIITPLLRKMAIQVNLVDKPNIRKIHHQNTPLIGGISIWIASTITIVIAMLSWQEFLKIKWLWIGGTILLFVGVLDDKNDIRASLKLAIQLLLAHFTFMQGIRITSLHGIFGIDTIPEEIQYILTIVVVTGVVNAFNLMDGIDGLAAGLAIIGLIVFTWLAWITGNQLLMTLYLSLIGALIGFLKYNFSKTKKIFMGDAGSLFLGFLLVVSAMILIQSAQKTEKITTVLPSVIGVLFLPVFDSLRVYRARIKQGKSPFKADKTHFHHLVLSLGLGHQLATILIVVVLCILLIISVIVGSLGGFTLMLIATLFVFWISSKILEINAEIVEWQEKIKKIEHQKF
ncbi:MAG: undecaprenyl/decaprenyl-phosphate alpha-N-acetylglucosaminyl 1-phosphate transferase [Raineya sp.]|jgi:UDP-GlcNAc:undecaprenyl-phosphate GlcNAc-1-phosphate transferase|nr:undecaprenyl/decaprenyl-phosphate alpha-N-acetylglucosaminyl 1-phosphate transferase [Raineya sp.]